jgi:hypothetical protein
MKYFWMFAFAFGMGSKSYACPNLTGSYLCKQNSYHKDTIYTFEQDQVNTHWRFTMTASTVDNKKLSSFTFLSDNVEREVVDSVTGQKLLTTAVCEKNMLKVFGTTKVGEAVIYFSEELSLNSEGHLINTSLNNQGETIQEICTTHTL